MLDNIGEFEGSVSPSYVTAPGNAAHSRTGLLFGRVIKIHTPSDQTNRSKQFFEYDVLVDVASEYVSPVRYVARRCILASTFGGVADFTRWTPRATEGNAFADKGYGLGSRVVLMNINGSAYGGIILGGVPSVDGPIATGQTSVSLSSSVPQPNTPDASLDPELLGGIDATKIYPNFLALVSKMLQGCLNRGARYVVESGFRSFAKQQQLYDAFKAGKNPFIAAPPGFSMHNYGLALDFVRDEDLLKQGVQALGASRNPEAYRILAEEAQKVGLEAGFFWSGNKFDPVHVEYKLTGKLKISSLKALVDQAHDEPRTDGSFPSEQEILQGIFQLLNVDASQSGTPPVNSNAIASFSAGTASGSAIANLGHHYIHQFNGVRQEIKDDGTYQVSVAGATKADGSLRDDSFKSKSGTNLLFQDGGITWTVKDHYTIEADGEFRFVSQNKTLLQSVNQIDITSDTGDINLKALGTVHTDSAFVKLGLGTDAMIKGTTYTNAEAIMLGNLAAALSALAPALAILAANPVISPDVPGGPISSTFVAASVAVGTAIAAISAFTGSMPTYLSLKNNLD